MDLIKDNIWKLYKKYFISAFGSAFIVCIYTMVDMIVVGKYHGPEGAAAMSVIAPIWNLVYSLGLFVGIGGSILYAVEKGKSTNRTSANRVFTASVILLCMIIVICSAGIFLFEDELFCFFGADEALLKMAKSYFSVPRFFIPCFMFSQMLSAFLRNDSAPGLATTSVIVGGVVNVLGDCFFVFGLDMGIQGAGIATALGAFVSVLIMLTHFFTRKCTIKLEKRGKMLRIWKWVGTYGFSAFFTDIAMGILTIFFNRQVMTYLGTNALAVYGVIVNVSTFVQSCAYGVGQATQPILSQNFGAGKIDRIRILLRYAIVTLTVLAGIWLAALMGTPNSFIHIFMTPTEAVLEIAPSIIRSYATSFPFLLLNIFATYYFPSVLQSRTAFVVSVARGILVSGILIMIAPLILPTASLWWTMTVTEVLTSIYAIVQMQRSLKTAGKQ